jgi:hypothetical protein
VRLLTNLWLRVDNRYLAPNRLFRHGELNPSSSAFRILMALFEHFAAAVRVAGARPIVVFFPDRQALEPARRGRETVFAPLVRELAARGIERVDLSKAFLGTSGDVSTWFLPVGDYSRHYTPAGNRVVAQWLGQEVLTYTTTAQPSDSAWRSSSAATVGWPRGCPKSDTLATDLRR